MEYLILIMLALSYTSQYCTSSSLCPSTYDLGQNGDGAFQFPVFHEMHPCIQASVQVSNVQNTWYSFEDDRIHKDRFLMAIGLGTPAIMNLVTIDTGSTLSWVQCRPCPINCHDQAEESGRIFDPLQSSTYQSVGCSTEDCGYVHETLGIPFCCNEEQDSCLYSLRYASEEYTAGSLVKDKLTLGNNFSIDDFMFGCSGDDRYNAADAGIIGFGGETYSFFRQVVRHTNYTTFSHCFPGNHRNGGFLSIGPYDRYNLQFIPLVEYGSHGDNPAYAIQQLDMMVDGIRLEVDPSIYATRMTILDSGTIDTFILSPVFRVFDKAITAAMLAKGYAREAAGRNKICFTSTSDSVNWRDMPTVEMKFVRSILKLPSENVFYRVSADKICSTFRPDVAGLTGVPILGNRATRSFRVVYDIQDSKFGFQAGAC
ncbi:aspartyl protease AED1-like [Triticum dicoccoides]|uniref:aspartyl protease AED1-like n=1 Tax=Triticum dicoccoides TaxID=85692 RepID=UPI00189158F8|nr:aspartyl protease AED1-like [Triticum dicoccoides]